MDSLLRALFILIVAAIGKASCLTLDTYLEWSTVQFQYESKTQENKDLKSGKYVPANVVILSANVFTGTNGTQIFVTTPDFIPGTPFTLSTVTSKKGNGGPILKPFPSAGVHKVSGDCNSITNVWRAKIDKYGRLWVVDNGKTNTLRALKYVCPPQILIYDLNNNNKLIRRYKVPGLSPISVLANVNFEYLDEKNNDNIIAYFNDEFSSSLVVYSFKNNTSFVVNHPYFSPDPYKAFFDLNGVKFYKMIGIDGVAISPTDERGKRTMYFHPLTAGREISVPTDILRDQTKNSFSDYMSNYKLLSDRGFHSSVESITKNGTMIFVNLEDNSLMSWNITNEYSTENFKTLIQDKERLQFPAHFQFTNENNTDYIYVTSTRLQNVVVGNPARNQINYRVLRGKL